MHNKKIILMAIALLIGSLHINASQIAKPAPQTKTTRSFFPSIARIIKPALVGLALASSPMAHADLINNSSEPIHIEVRCPDTPDIALLAQTLQPDDRIIGIQKIQGLCLLDTGGVFVSKPIEPVNATLTNTKLIPMHIELRCQSTPDIISLTKTLQPGDSVNSTELIAECLPDNGNLYLPKPIMSVTAVISNNQYYYNANGTLGYRRGLNAK